MKKFLVQNIIVVFFVNAGSALNYLFQVLAGRGLALEQYGLFNSLTSVLIVLSVFTSVLPLVLSRLTVNLIQEGADKVGGLISAVLGWFSLLAVGLFLVLTVFSSIIANLVNIQSTTPVFVIAAAVALGALTPIPAGVLQGLQKFKQYGLYSCAAPTVKLFCLILFVFVLDLGANGALLSLPVSALAALLFGLFILRTYLKGPKTKPTKLVAKSMINFSGPTLLMTQGIALLMSLDMIFVRLFCYPNEAGYYATAAVLGRIPMFLSGMLVTVLFPEAARQKSTIEGLGNLKTSFLLNLLLAGGFSLVVILFARPIIELMYGQTYAPAAPLLHITTLSMAAMSTTNVIFGYCLARGANQFNYFLYSGIIGFSLITLLWHDHPLQIAYCHLTFTVAILLATTVWFVLKFLGDGGSSIPTEDEATQSY